MKTLQTYLSITLLIALSSVAAAQPELPRLPAPANKEREPNSPWYNQVIVEFPGHQYSLEIAVKPVKETIDGVERTVQTVFAYVSDTHFEPIKIDTQEIRLNFVVDRRPRSFVLLPVKVDPRPESERKPQSIFELKDADLAKLIESGWQGNATANMQVQVGRNRVPYNARLMQAKDFKQHRH